MTALHKLDESPSFLKEISQKIDDSLSSGVEALKDYIGKIMSSNQPGDFSQHELNITNIVRGIGQQALALSLSTYDMSERRITDEDANLYRCKSLDLI